MKGLKKIYQSIPRRQNNQTLQQTKLQRKIVLIEFNIIMELKLTVQLQNL